MRRDKERATLTDAIGDLEALRDHAQSVIRGFLDLDDVWTYRAAARAIFEAEWPDLNTADGEIPPVDWDRPQHSWLHKTVTDIVRLACARAFRTHMEIEQEGSPEMKAAIHPTILRLSEVYGNLVEMTDENEKAKEALGGSPSCLGADGPHQEG